MFPILIAEVAADTFSWVGPIIQLVQFGGFGGLVWYLLYIHIPQQAKAHLDERREWMAYSQHRDSRFEESLERCIKCIEESNGHARRT